MSAVLRNTLIAVAIVALIVLIVWLDFTAKTAPAFGATTPKQNYPHVLVSGFSLGRELNNANFYRGRADRLTVTLTNTGRGKVVQFRLWAYRKGHPFLMKLVRVHDDRLAFIGSKWATIYTMILPSKQTATIVLDISPGATKYCIGGPSRICT